MTAKRLVKMGFYYLAHLRLARLTAALLLKTVQTVDGRSSAGGKRVLILNAGKDGVLQDFQACFDNSAFELIVWPNAALDRIAAAILAPGLSHDRYVTADPAVEASKLAYRRFLRDVWKHFVAKLPVDVVMSVNFGYYVQREFATALEEHGTPFIVLQKENLNGMSQRRANFWRAVYETGRGRFTGRKILVYNDTERELQISAGVVEHDKTVVTGMPRLDRVHVWRREQAGSRDENPQVLFFGFSRTDKVPILFGKKREKLSALLATSAALTTAEEEWSGLRWDELCAGTCQAIATFARSRPKVQVIVKTKGQTTQAEEMLSLLKGDGDLPPNIKIVRGGDAFDLIKGSSVVVGFNTTGLIEAIAAGKPVVVPWFAEAKKDAARDIILDLGEAADYADSPEQLIEKVGLHLRAKSAPPHTLPPSSCATLRRLVGNDDGGASRRVLEEVEKEIRPR
jgi:hypothetical protein